jgi:hypothetical protein
MPRGERRKMPLAHRDSVSTPGELLPAIHDIGFDGVASDCFVGQEQSLEADDAAFAGVSCSDKTKVSKTFEIKAWC